VNVRKKCIKPEKYYPNNLKTQKYNILAIHRDSIKHTKLAKKHARWKGVKNETSNKNVDRITVRIVTDISGYKKRFSGCQDLIKTGRIGRRCPFCCATLLYDYCAPVTNEAIKFPGKVSRLPY
jgi:hypothetical protein